MWKFRRARIGHLWVQEKESTGELEYRKVKGESNPADAGTKYLPEHKMLQFMEAVLQTSVTGRAQESLNVQGGLAEKAN